jgi:hypothetical protein
MKKSAGRAASSQRASTAGRRCFAYSAAGAGEPARFACVSRAYRVEVVPLHSARADVEQSDQLCIDVALLPILGDEPMRQLLLSELEKDGWTTTADGGRTKTVASGVVATIDAAGRTVTVTMVAQRVVSAGGNTRADADAAAAAAAAAAAVDVKRAATTQLSRVEGDVRAAVEAAVQRVYVEALQQKARTLGHVESMQRREGDDGSVEITIKVRA